jgi:putative ABC transport system permease protein
MNMFRLSMRYMKIQKRRTILTIVGIVLSVALVSGTGILITSYLNMRLTKAEIENGTWHYSVSNITDYNKAVALKSNALIKKAGLATRDTYAQIGKKSGASGQLKATDYNYLKLNEFDISALSMMPYTVTKGRMPKNNNEIVLGNNASSLFTDNIKIGDKITYPVGTYERVFKLGQESADDDYTFSQTGSRTFTVVGFYNYGVYDWQSNVCNAVTLNPSGAHQYSVYVQMKPGVNFPQSIRKAVKDCELSTDSISENGIVEWMGKSASTKVRNTVVTTFLILAAIILAVMMLVIRNAFAMSVSEKISQIGTLRCLGASPNHIRNLILSEALIIWIFALPIGILCGFGAMAAVLSIVRNVDPADLAYLRISASVWPFVLTAILSFAAVMLSARRPIKSAMKMPMIEAVRGNAVYRDDRILRNRKGRILGKLFGFSGMLAAKNIRRNPKRFRTTLLSVIVSVVLFIAVGGFSMSISASLQNASNLYGGIDYEFTASSGLSSAIQGLDTTEQSVKDLDTVENVQKTAAYNVTLNIPLARVPKNYTSIYKEFTGNSAMYSNNKKTLPRSIRILEVSRKNYNSIRFSGKAPTYDELLAGKGALFCQTETFISSGGRVATADFSNYKPGETITVTQTFGGESTEAEKTNAKTQNLNFKISGLLAEKPWYAYNADGYLIVAEENIGVYDTSKLSGANVSDGGQTFLEIKYAKGFEEKADAQMKQLSVTAKNAGDGFHSVYQDTRGNRNQYLIMEIFVYGFTSIIILISCINIFNTIHANLLTRKREIAMTRAVGMDQVQLVRMLLLECALYGLIGTIWGSVIGVPLQLLLIKSFGHVILADMQSPLLFVIISLLVSVGIGILAGYSSIRRTLKSSIVEEIRAQE